jgi:hypothetical protein
MHLILQQRRHRGVKFFLFYLWGQVNCCSYIAFEIKNLIFPCYPQTIEMWKQAS